MYDDFDSAPPGDASDRGRSRESGRGGGYQGPRRPQQQQQQRSSSRDQQQQRHPQHQQYRSSRHGLPQDSSAASRSPPPPRGGGGGSGGGGDEYYYRDRDRDHSDKRRGGGDGRRYDSTHRGRDRDGDRGDRYREYDAPTYRRRDSPSERERGGRSPERGGRGRDRDRDQGQERDGYRSRGRSQRSPPARDYGSPYDSPDETHYHDGGGGGHRSGPGRPYHTLKIDDVPRYMSSQEIEGSMRQLGASGLVEVRIKSDDRNGDRRCYAFAEFKSEDDAADFLEQHYPSFDIEAGEGGRARLYMAYSRERRQAAAHSEDWLCTMCHFENFSRRATCKQCKAPRASEHVMELELDGKSDECPQQTPSQFLVIRDLPGSVNETVLATGIKKLYVAKEDEPKQAPGAPPKLKSTAPVGNTSGLGAKPGSLIRIFMIRDKASDITSRYGFAEFSTLEDARAAMAKFKASPQFTIASKPVSVAYIHSGVFIPYFKPVLTEKDQKTTFAATHNPSLRLSYWSPSVYASEFTIFSESLYEEKASDKAATDPSANSASKDSKKRKADKDLTQPNGKKVIAMAPQLAKWANKHAELHGAAAKASASSASSNPDEKNIPPPTTGPNSLGAFSVDQPPPEPQQQQQPSMHLVSYADLERMCCLLCRRKFLSEPSLQRHEQLSEMHKGNLANDRAVEKAIAALKAVGKEPISNYRDRAKERRLAHNQPTKPKSKPHLPRKKPAGEEKEEKSPAPAPAMSKGAGLLAKMGWTAGTAAGTGGLGAGGAGRTEIVETTAYAPGVGLGAEGGKLGDAVEEAARATRGEYKDFVSLAKEKARERFEKME